MAYAPARSANQELLMGTAEGSYKAVVRNRGGVVEDLTWHSRQSLDCKYYAIVEDDTWDSPDCRQFTPLNHTSTPEHMRH